MHLICPPTTLAFKMYLQWRRNSQTTSWEARKEMSTSLSPKDTKYPGSQEIQKFVSIYFKKWEQGSPMQHFWAQRHCFKHFGPDYQNPHTHRDRRCHLQDMGSASPCLLGVPVTLSSKQRHLHMKLLLHSPPVPTWKAGGGMTTGHWPHTSECLTLWRAAVEAGKERKAPSSAFLYLFAINTSSAAKTRKPHYSSPTPWLNTS